jgi:outer membrane protein assembly factor BamB
MRTKMTLYFLLIISLYVLYVQDVYCQAQGEIPWPTLMDSPWPMIKHDPQATGRSPYVGPKTANIIWTMDLEYGVYSGPIIDLENNLYVGTNTWLPHDTTNYFYSIYSKGSLRWTLYTGEAFSTNSGFLIGSDSTIYIGSQGGYIYAVDFEGNLKWKQDYGINIFSHVMNIDKDSTIYFTSADEYLYSIYKNNGEIRWKIKYDGGFGASSPIFSPEGETIYVAGHDNYLYALNLDGSLKWRFNHGPVSVVPLVDNDGNIYVIGKVDSVGLHSISPDGSIRWSYNFANWLAGRSLLEFITMDKDGNLYFHSWINTIQQSKITSVDYEGNFRWEYSFEQPGEEIAVPLICDADGTVYCGSTWGYYYYAISSKGELLWKLPLNGYQVDNSGALGSDGTLYIGTHLGSLVTGQEKTLIAIRDTLTSVDEYNSQITEYILEQNYPNPFNSTTNIRYAIPESGRVTLTIYDLMGSEVAKLIDRYQEAGRYDVIFQPKDLASGIYFYKLTSGNYAATKKLILLK